jgi:hypothetical protein
MGIGGGLLLIAVGAILTYAIKVEVQYLNLEVTGWVLMLAGGAVLLLTMWFWNSRRRARPDTLTPYDVSVLDETRIAHSHAILDPQPPGSHLRPPPRP